MRDSPSVLSLGKLCQENGFGFIWPPAASPMLLLPDGTCCEIPVHSFVPVLENVTVADSASVSSAFNSLVQLAKHNTVQLMPAPSLSIRYICNGFASIEEQYMQFKATGLPSYKLLFELCCESSSTLGIIAPNHKFFVIRVTEDHDLLSHSTVQLLTQICLQEQFAHAHASVPCTPWSRLQNVNIAQAENPRLYRQRLSRQRKASRAMLANVSFVLEHICGSRSFEWPDSAYDGWNDESCENLCEKACLEHVARVSSCACHCFHPVTGEPFGKTFRFKTDNPALAESLSILSCPGGHTHARTEGQFTKPSANYKPKLAKQFFIGLDKVNKENGFDQLPVLSVSALDDEPAPPAEVEAFVEVEELTVSQKEKLKHIALSTDHLMTHRPANPFCEHCMQAFQRRKKHYASKTALPVAKHFGEKIYADIVFASKSEPGFNNDVCCF